MKIVIFDWEVTDKVDSLERIFDDKFVVVDGAGKSQTKKQYIALLRSGTFTHDRVDVAENTATVVGKGTFTATASGKKITLHLSYVEVFTKPSPGKPWTILAMHPTVLQ